MRKYLVILILQLTLIFFCKSLFGWSSKEQIVYIENEVEIEHMIPSPPKEKRFCIIMSDYGNQMIEKLESEGCKIISVEPMNVPYGPYGYYNLLITYQ